MRTLKVLISHRRHRYPGRYVNTFTTSDPNLSIRTIIVFVALLAAILPASASERAERGRDWSLGKAGNHYVDEVARICPAKRLYWVSHNDMFELASLFRKTLPRDLRRSFDLKSGFRRRWDSVSACPGPGVSCDDHHMLIAIDKLGLMSRFARRVCASYDSCLSTANCTSAPDAKGGLGLD